MARSILDKPFFRDEAAAYAKLESIIWPNGPKCVHCGSTGRRPRTPGKRSCRWRSLAVACHWHDGRAGTRHITLV